MPSRSSDLRSKRDTFAVYVRRGSAQVLLVATVVLSLARFIVGGFGRGDLIVLAATIMMVGTVEWVIHKFLLHAPADAWTTRTLGTGTGHREHHLDPPAIDWLMLRAMDAIVFVVAFGAVTVGWSVPLMALTGSALLGPYLTGWMLAALGLAHYEWVHLLVHTRYRPRTRYYRRLARHHRLHHFRNEHYWLGVTSTTGDVMMRTRPRHAADVPVSDTARTLDANVTQPT